MNSNSCQYSINYYYYGNVCTKASQFYQKISKSNTLKPIRDYNQNGNENTGLKETNRQIWRIWMLLNWSTLNEQMWSSFIKVQHRICCKAETLRCEKLQMNESILSEHKHQTPERTDP